MRGYMFRNRWFALLFVGMVLAGVANLVGTEAGGGAISAAQTQFADQREQAEALVDHGPPGEGEPDIELQFTPDEELIDAATGYDPTPVDEFAAAQEVGSEVVPDTQVVIFADDGGQRAGQ
ncbi:hypothetical protein N0B51_01375 [Tsuneonella sp. YG55]|uniref:Uncharacterized protein n=1 Tax=Tsuneonella litorea TaxID=2976475 RepID=A0A9X2VZC0_9SPHN|nr:hypothetical protein [Tsuneonella litorea]MCT2557624.1 hypothetical protein [Tsuneonella litorea]